MYNIKKLFHKYLEKYPLMIKIDQNEYDTTIININAQLDEIKNKEELKKLLKDKLKWKLYINSRFEYILYNYNYLFAMLYEIDKNLVSDKMINNYLKICENEKFNVIFKNIISHNIINLYNSDKLEPLIINKLLNYNNQKQGCMCINEECAKKLLSNIFNYNDHNILYSGLIDMYIDYNKLNNDNIIRLINYYNNGFAISSATYNNEWNYFYNYNINFDYIIKILENNNYPKTTKYFLYLINNTNIQQNIKLFKYFYEEEIDIDIVHRLLFEEFDDYYDYQCFGVNIYKEIIDNYPNQKIKILNNYFNYCKKFEDDIVDYYIEFNDILFNIIKSLEVTDLYKIEKILYKSAYIDNTFESFKKIIECDNVQVNNLYEYFIYRGYKPNQRSLELACKYKNLNMCEKFIIDHNMIPNGECLEQLFKCKSTHANNYDGTKNALEILKIILSHKVLVTNEIIYKCIEFDKCYNSSFLLILLENIVEINDKIILYIIKNNLHIDYFKNHNIYFDEKLYYYCHFHDIDLELCLFNIDKHILNLRKMCKYSKLDQILEYVKIYDVEFDNYCFANAILNNDVKVIQYMSNNYIMPLYCLHTFVKNKKNKNKKYSVFEKNIEYLMNECDQQKIMIQKCTRK